MWVGGNLAFGYEMKDGKIAIVEEEAELVRLIFRRYLELDSVNELLGYLKERNIRTRTKLLSTGATRGGIPFGCRPTRDAVATRCPAQSAGRSRAPAGSDPTAFVSGSAAADRPRIDQAEAPATTARPASRRPIAADDEAASATGQAEPPQRRLRSPRIPP